MDKVLDGRTRTVTWDDFMPEKCRGTVLRMVQSDPSALPSFSDQLVVNTTTNDRGDLQVTLARPYAFVSGAGTTSPTVLTGVEQYVVPASRIVGPDSPFRVVLLSTGQVQSHTT